MSREQPASETAAINPIVSAANVCFIYIFISTLRDTSSGGCSLRCVRRLHQDQARSDRRQIDPIAEAAEVESLANRAPNGDARAFARHSAVGHHPELAGLVTEPVGATIGERVAVHDRAGHAD